MSKRSSQRHRQERREREGEKHLDSMEVKALDELGAIIERQTKPGESRQPRFTEPRSIFSSVLRWILSSMTHEPDRHASVREWDKWYRAIVQDEPFLAGIFNGAVQIDTNRGWTLTGGRNQVARYTKVINSFDRFIKVGNKYVEGNGGGWRAYSSWQAQSYYATRMGLVSEVGRVGRGGPLFTMWSVDPARCELTGNPVVPLKYYPSTGAMQEWGYDSYIRKCSLISTDESAIGYGFPAVARCYSLAKIMASILSHYMQKLGAKTPDAILTGKYIGEEQWNEAIRARNENLLADPDSYLNSIATIMSSGGDMPEFALTTLSNLPDRWDLDLWARWLMRGYELAFGYKGEFTYENAGVLGRGNEVEVQHRNATAMGGKDYILAHQGELQRTLPPTLEFAYEERDVTGETEDAQLKLAKAQVITEMTKWLVNTQNVLTSEQVLQLAAQEAIIPEDWTPTEEDVTATDEEAPDSERIYRACMAFPDEPIVRYSWPSGKTRVLNIPSRRQFYFPTTINRSYADYRREIAGMARQLWSGGLSPFEFADNMFSIMRRNFTIAWREGARSVGVTDIGDEAMLEIQDYLQEQAQYLPGFSDFIQANNKESGAKLNTLDVRIDMWANRYQEVTSMAKLYHIENQPLEWVMNPSKEHCADCAALNGRVYSKKTWDKYNLRPQMHELECKGFQCGCKFAKTKKPITKGAPPKLMGMAA